MFLLKGFVLYLDIKRRRSSAQVKPALYIQPNGNDVFFRLALSLTREGIYPL